MAKSVGKQGRNDSIKQLCIQPPSQIQRELYTEMFYAIITALFPYLLLMMNGLLL